MGAAVLGHWVISFFSVDHYGNGAVSLLPTVALPLRDPAHPLKLLHNPNLLLQLPGNGRWSWPWSCCEAFVRVPINTLGFPGVTTSIWNRSTVACEIRHQTITEVVNKPTVNTKSSNAVLFSAERNSLCTIRSKLDHRGIILTIIDVCSD